MMLLEGTVFFHTRSALTETAKNNCYLLALCCVDLDLSPSLSTTNIYKRSYTECKADIFEQFYKRYGVSAAVVPHAWSQKMAHFFRLEIWYWTENGITIATVLSPRVTTAMLLLRRMEFVQSPGVRQQLSLLSQPLLCSFLTAITAGSRLPKPGRDTLH